MFRFLNKMYVILFFTFFLFSLFFIVLISKLYNVYWDSLFKDYHQQTIKSHAYKLLDDMRERNIQSGPLSEEEVEWLDRRIRLYGLMVELTDESKKEVRYNSITDGEGEFTFIEEIPYIIDGHVAGYMRAAFLEASKELNPAMVNFRETLHNRSKYLFGAIMILSVLVSFWLAFMLTKQLKRLDQFAQSIRQGKWVKPMPNKGTEEIRCLALTLSELSAELQKQEEWRKNLIEDITHELRTPITSIMTKLEAIIDGVYEADEIQLEKMYGELERLSRLVSDLQRLSEAEGAQFAMHKKRRDIVKLAKQVFANYQPLAVKSGIRMIFEPAHTPAYAEVDYDKMYQVIANIVANAIKYTSSGGKIVLKVRWTKSHTMIICQDDGIGISEEDLPYIFNRLYRADKSRSRFTGGVGLGLSIAKALIEAHEGSIEVQSKLGEGSMFTVLLPNPNASK
ncbi:sensor histidine kinase [Marinicrinis lubricantis]|uniref:histidine kinase n=1 Tax=Marinicrinis lubricantis TaxID=2086470 RepID=A0ABW1IVN9_9BACL